LGINGNKTPNPHKHADCTRSCQVHYQTNFLKSDASDYDIGTNPAVFRRTMAGIREGGYVKSGKGHGAGWQLARRLDKITLLAVYEALGRPTLFAIGNRDEHPDCRVQKNVNAALSI